MVKRHSLMLVKPADFRVNTELAADNQYMDLLEPVDADRALQQSNDLIRLLKKHDIKVASFPGEPETPDAVFPNNIFATTRDRFIIGHMLHPRRQKDSRCSLDAKTFNIRVCF